MWCAIKTHCWSTKSTEKMQIVFKLKTIKHSRKSQNTCTANQIQALSKLQIVLIYFHLFWISPLVMGKERYIQFYQARTIFSTTTLWFSLVPIKLYFLYTANMHKRTKDKFKGRSDYMYRLNIISKVIKELSKFLASHNHVVNGLVESVSLRTWLCQSVQWCVIVPFRCPVWGPFCHRFCPILCNETYKFSL